MGGISGRMIGDRTSRAQEGEAAPSVWYLCKVGAVNLVRLGQKEKPFDFDCSKRLEFTGVNHSFQMVKQKRMGVFSVTQFQSNHIIMNEVIEHTLST